MSYLFLILVLLGQAAAQALPPQTFCQLSCTSSNCSSCPTGVTLPCNGACLAVGNYYGIVDCTTSTFQYYSDNACQVIIFGYVISFGSTCLAGPTDYTTFATNCPAGRSPTPTPTPAPVSYCIQKNCADSDCTSGCEAPVPLACGVCTDVFNIGGQYYATLSCTTGQITLTQLNCFNQPEIFTAPACINAVSRGWGGVSADIIVCPTSATSAPAPTPTPTPAPCTEVCVSFYSDINGVCAGSVDSTHRLCGNVPFDPDYYFGNQIDLFNNITINLPAMTISNVPGQLGDASFTYGTCFNLGDRFSIIINQCPTSTPSPTPTPTPSCPQLCDVLNTPCTTNNDCPAPKSCTGSLCLYGTCSNGCPTGTTCFSPNCADTQPICSGGNPANCPDHFYNCNVHCPAPSPTPTPTPVSICGNGILETGEQCDSTPCCTSSCQFAAAGTACSDTTVCNGAETCDASGTCQAGITLDCNDNNQCTDDFCHVVLGCQHPFLTGPSCNDGNACTINDMCVGGSCSGTALSCDDSNVCTDDSCNPATGCVNTNNIAPCNDGLFCTVSDVCAAGSCSGVPKVCTDNIDCTVDTCNEANDVCVFTPSDSLCNDNSLCTPLDTCSATLGCQYTTKDCTDAYACSVDTCNSIDGSCSHNFTACCRNCALTHGYWKNHVDQFYASNPRSYTNWICNGTIIKKTLVDPIYYMSSSTTSSWLQAYRQYEAAWTSYLATATNKCQAYGLTSLLNYFGTQSVVDCVLFLRTSLQTAYPSSTSNPFPRCVTSPVFSSSVDQTRAGQCASLLTDFVNGRLTVPNCDGNVAFAVFIENNQVYVENSGAISAYASSTKLNPWY